MIADSKGDGAVAIGSITNHASSEQTTEAGDAGLGCADPDVRMHYLASPPLCVAYAIAGTMDKRDGPAGRYLIERLRPAAGNEQAVKRAAAHERELHYL